MRHVLSSTVLADLGEGVCAFVRGGEVLVAAAVVPGAVVRLPQGWRDVLGVEGLALGVA